MVNKDMPKYAREKTLGEKVLDGAKDFGKSFLRNWYVALATLLGVYLGFSFYTGELHPSKWNEAKSIRQKQEIHIDRINSDYNKFFEYAVNFEDSMRIYKQLGLEKYVEFKEPSLEDKERIVGE